MSRVNLSQWIRHDVDTDQCQGDPASVGQTQCRHQPSPGRTYLGGKIGVNKDQVRGDPTSVVRYGVDIACVPVYPTSVVRHSVDTASPDRLTSVVKHGIETAQVQEDPLSGGQKQCTHSQSIGRFPPRWSDTVDTACARYPPKWVRLV